MGKEDARSRYDDIVAAAERVRAQGDHGEADRLMGVAQAAAELERRQTVASNEQDNYDRAHAPIEPTEE